MAFGVDVNIVGLKALRSQLNKLGRKKELSEAMRKKLTDAWISGVNAFIREAVQRVKVDTGMTAATFLDLSRAIKSNNAEKFIETIIKTKQSGRRPGVPTFPSGDRDQTRSQSRFEGERLGKKAYTFRVPQAGAKQIVFSFSFQTVAFQHALFEDDVQSLEAGILAFEERIRIRFERDARFVLSEFLRGRIVRTQGIT